MDEENKVNEETQKKLEWFRKFTANRAEVYASKVDGVYKFGNIIEDRDKPLQFFYNGKMYPTNGAKRFIGMYDKNGHPIFNGNNVIWTGEHGEIRGRIVRISTNYAIKVTSVDWVGPNAPKEPNLFLEPSDDKHLTVIDPII